MKRQPFVPRLAMVCAPRRHGRRRLLCLGQTLMRRANVIGRAYQAHPLIQRQGRACQCPATTRQRREAFPERRVEPLKVRGVEHPAAWRAASERLHAGQRASGPAAVRRDHTAPCIALDDLGEPDLAPRTQSGPSALARRQGIAPGLPHGPAV